MCMQMTDELLLWPQGSAVLVSTDLSLKYWADQDNEHMGKLFYC